jgi:hypothetical protein
LIRLPILVASAICALGCFWAFDRGAPDFSVFMHAADLVRCGRAMELYVDSPDRYLYAPAFAWLMVPLTFLPRTLALGLWCALKIGALVSMARCLSRGVTQTRIAWALALAVIVVARPLLIEFQYGQVNLMVIAAVVGALSTLAPSSQGHPRRVGWAWFFATVAALTKLMALPVLAVPLLQGWFARKSVLPALRGMALAMGLMVLLPLSTLGPSRTLELHLAWREGVIAKGLPLESHNQSVAASMERWFSGNPTRILALGPEPISMTWFVIPSGARHLLTGLWTALALCIVGLALVRHARLSAPESVAWLVGVLLLPLHLVWKPYFVAELPLVLVLLLASREQISTRRAVALLCVLFTINNLTSIDVWGVQWGGRIEALSILFFGLLALLYGTQRLSSSPLTPSKLSAGESKPFSIFPKIV